MRLDRRTRARIALPLFVLLSVASGVEVAARLALPNLRAAGGVDPVTRYDLRFQSLRDELPPRGVIGYVSDKQTAGHFTSLEGMKEYFMTQYSLAPVIVVVGPEADLVVGNFPGAPPPSLPAGLEGRSFTAWGDGVFLFGERAQ
jgi:hypothetical protein